MNDEEVAAMERRARAYRRPGDRSTPAAMLADDLLTLIGMIREDEAEQVREWDSWDRD